MCATWCFSCFSHGLWIEICLCPHLHFQLTLCWQILPCSISPNMWKFKNSGFGGWITRFIGCVFLPTFAGFSLRHARVVWGWAGVFVKRHMGGHTQLQPPGNVLLRQKRSSFSPKKQNFSQITSSSVIYAFHKRWAVIRDSVIRSEKCCNLENLLGFPAAVRLASGLDTGPCSGHPGRVHCLGVWRWINNTRKKKKQRKRRYTSTLMYIKSQKEEKQQ